MNDHVTYMYMCYIIIILIIIIIIIPTLVYMLFGTAIPTSLDNSGTKVILLFPGDPYTLAKLAIAIASFTLATSSWTE